MPVRYSGSAIYRTFPSSSRTDLADSLRDALVAAGWTVASGASGNWKLDSASTPSGHRIRVRIYDPGSGNCTRLRLMTVDESIAPAADVFIRPGFRYVVLACAYQFFAFVPGTIEARTYVGAGVPWLPSFLSPAHVGWMQGNATSDTDTGGNKRCFRSSDGGPYTGNVMQISIYDASGWSDTASAPNGSQGLVIPVDSALNYVGYRWYGGGLFTADPLIAWGITSASDTAVVVGQLWDSFLVCGDWGVGSGLDRTIRYNGRDWWCVFYNYPGPKVTLAVLKP